MDKFIVKAFGVNRFNFWGWVAVGVAISVYSLRLLNRGDVGRATYFVLLGIFAVLLQTYCAMLAEKIDPRSHFAKAEQGNAADSR
jgi:hypothetical protein